MPEPIGSDLTQALLTMVANLREHRIAVIRLTALQECVNGH
jgi:hypothetical protein